jgi:hypothetical protein
MLYRNDVIQISESGLRYRILALDPKSNTAWLFALGNPKAFPEPRALDELRQLESAKGLERATGGPEIFLNHLTERATARRNTAWLRIKPLVENPQILERKLRGALVNARARELGCSEQTLYAGLRRYWAGGQTLDALIYATFRCGRKKDPGTGGRGRKPHKGRYEIYQITPKEYEKIDQVIRKRYLKKATASAAQAYQGLLEDFYSYRDGNGKIHIRPLGERPTKRQFYRLLGQRFGLEQTIRSREGDKEFERNHRAKLGSTIFDCLGVGDIYEFDATIADLWLVAEHDRSRIIGKPTLYLICDRRSQLIVGFYVGLESASWPAARQAILSIAEDKAALCQRYGVEYDPDDWPADGIFPKQFVADRGEMLSHDSSRLVTILDIPVVNLPSKRPDGKGSIECKFKLTRVTLADSAPGYEPPENVHKRCGKHYERDACLTLDEFIAHILNFIILHNRKIMQNYPLSSDQLSRNVSPSPREIWVDDVLHNGALGTRYDERHVRFALLERDVATVTRQGIRFKGCYYSCQEALRDGWFTRAGRGTYKLNISYDRRLVDAIYIHDPADRTRFITARLIEKSSSNRYKGFSFDEVKAWQYFENAIKRTGEQSNHQAVADFHAAVNPIAKAAHKNMRLVTKGKSRRSRRADVKLDRENERRERRRNEAAMPSINETPGRAPAAIIPLTPRPATDTDITAIPSPAASDNAPGASPSLAEKIRLKRQEMLHEYTTD